MVDSKRPITTLRFFPDAEYVEDKYGKQIPLGRQMPTDISERIAWDMEFLKSLKREKA